MTTLTIDGGGCSNCNSGQKREEGDCELHVAGIDGTIADRRHRLDWNRLTERVFVSKVISKVQRTGGCRMGEWGNAQIMYSGQTEGQSWSGIKE